MWASPRRRVSGCGLIQGLCWSSWHVVCKCSVIGVGNDSHSEVWDDRRCTQ